MDWSNYQWKRSCSLRSASCALSYQLLVGIKLSIQSPKKAFFSFGARKGINSTSSLHKELFNPILKEEWLQWIANSYLHCGFFPYSSHMALKSSILNSLCVHNNFHAYNTSVYYRMPHIVLQLLYGNAFKNMMSSEHNSISGFEIYEVTVGWISFSRPVPNLQLPPNLTLLHIIHYINSNWQELLLLLRCDVISHSEKCFPIWTSEL